MSSKYSDSNILTAMKVHEIDLSKLVFGKRKRNVIPISYGQESKLFVFQTPFMRCITDPVSTKYEDIHSIEVELIDDNYKSKDFKLFINQLEDSFVSRIEKTPQIWFDSDQPIDKVNFRVILRDDNTLKLILSRTNKFKTLIIDEKNKELDLNQLKEGSNVKLLLELKYTWVDEPNTVGISLLLHKVLVRSKPKEIISEYSFANSDDENTPEEVILQTEENLRKKKVVSIKQNQRQNQSPIQIIKRTQITPIEKDEIIKLDKGKTSRNNYNLQLPNSNANSNTNDNTIGNANSNTNSNVNRNNKVYANGNTNINTNGNINRNTNSNINTNINGNANNNIRTNSISDSNNESTDKEEDNLNQIPLINFKTEQRIPINLQSLQQQSNQNNFMMPPHKRQIQESDSDEDHFDIIPSSDDD
jgi:hypothetical protein